MTHPNRKNSLFWVLVLILQVVQGVPVPNPNPQVLPGQIPPHLSTHPALSSITQGRESALMQYAYNIQNRRGPSPSPLVLQNNQERNLQLVNQLSHQRSGQSFIPGAGPNTQGGGHTHSQGNENPELRALETLNKYKGQDQPSTSYNNPTAFTPSNGGHSNYPPHGVGHGHSHGPSAAPPVDENEGEDIRKLKSILNLAGRPIPGSSSSNYGNSGSPGGNGDRGGFNPGQYGQHPYPNSNNNNNHHHNHGHGHNHPTPFPATAQSQNSLGQLQFGPSARPSLYHGSGSGSNGHPPGINVPYGTDPHHHHGQDRHSHHGQDARTLIQSLETPSEAYQNLIYIDPVREPTSINKHVGPSQSVFILPASDYNGDDYQRLLNRPAEILIDVIPATSTSSGKQESGNDFSLHNFSLLLTPSTYARCAQATHKRGYGGKCKLILKVGRKGSTIAQPVQVSYSK